MTTGADVADLLEIPRPYFKRLLGTRQERAKYSIFTVPKKRGGGRQIAVPPKPLRILQEKLNYVLQLVYTPKPAVHGYRWKHSIRTNAARHVQRRWILNVDLEDFFPSIHLGRVRGAFMARPFELPQYAATALAQVCTMANGVLPQGAPTSPFVSNIICARLDGQLMAIAKKLGLTYTRYCDDITLSCNRDQFPPSIASATGGWIGSNVVVGDTLGSVISQNGFRINTGKTRLQFRGQHQEVTGLVVNKFVNVPWAYVREVRGLLHAWRRFGKTLAAMSFCERDQHPFSGTENAEMHFGAVLRGRIEYIGFIRGRTDPVYCTLRNTLHECEPTLIRAAPTPGQYPGGTPWVSSDRWSNLLGKRRTAIALLEVTSTTRSTRLGSAFAIDGGTIVTAAHNLDGCVHLVRGTGNREIKAARFHSMGRHVIDGALVPIDHGLTSIQTDRRIPEAGEPIAVLGYASIPDRHPDLGIYSGTVESVRNNYRQTLQLLQISVASAGGLSGGPVIDSRGRVIGIVIESAYEETMERVPGREYCTVLPIHYILDISTRGVLVEL